MFGLLFLLYLTIILLIFDLKPGERGERERYTVDRERQIVKNFIFYQPDKEEKIFC